MTRGPFATVKALLIALAVRRDEAIQDVSEQLDQEGD